MDQIFNVVLIKKPKPSCMKDASGDERVHICLALLLFHPDTLYLDKNVINGRIWCKLVTALLRARGLSSWNQLSLTTKDGRELQEMRSGIAYVNTTAGLLCGVMSSVLSRRAGINNGSGGRKGTEQRRAAYITANYTALQFCSRFSRQDGLRRLLTWNRQDI